MSESRKTIKGSINVDVFAFCSKCGAPNHYIHTITEEEEFRFVFDSKTSNEAAKRELAEPKLKEKLIASREQFIKKVEAGNFNDLDCSCAQCEHIEHWSQHNKSLASCLVPILGIVSVVGLIGTLFHSVIFLALLLLALPAFICMLIINTSRNRRYKNLTKAMDRRYLPIAAEDMEKLRQKVAAAFPGEDIVIPQ